MPIALRQRHTEAPVIETARLRLRAHTLEDFEDCVAMWSDPEVCRYTIGAPCPAQRTWMRVLGYRGHWAYLGFGYWAVEEKASGRYVGELGFADFKREMEPSIEGIPELGWALATHAHGKGYATEALKAVTAWGDAQFVGPRAVCIISPQNRASLRVAEKIGFRELTRTVKEGAPADILFERLRPGGA